MRNRRRLNRANSLSPYDFQHILAQSFGSKFGSNFTILYRSNVTLHESIKVTYY